MAKPEWGTKQTCQSCGTRFYDLRRDPVACPKCGARQDRNVDPRAKGNVTTTAQTQTAAFPPADEAETPVGRLVEGDEEVTVEEEGATVEHKKEEGATVEHKKEEGATVEHKKEEGDEDLIEDVSELGEDDKALADVTDGNRDDEDETH